MNICPVCKTELAVQEYSVHNPVTGPVIIGPGSENQLTIKRKIFCPQCGIQFYRMPQPNEHSETDRTDGQV